MTIFLLLWIGLLVLRERARPRPGDRSPPADAADRPARRPAACGAVLAGPGSGRRSAA